MYRYRSKLLYTFSLLICLLMVATGCHQNSQPKQNGLKIVTSFYPVYAITKAIAGENNTVTMIHSINGIHNYEPSANDISEIYKADIFFYHSHTLEPWAGKLDRTKEKSKVQIFEASKSLPLQKVQGLESMPIEKGMDPATLYDPHTWSDPLLAAKEAEIIANNLSQVDPKHKAIYEANAKSFTKEAKRITDLYTKKFNDVSQHTFVTQHTAFSYLADRFNLKQLGIAGISPEQEPTSRQLKEIRDFVKQYHVKTIFVEENVSQKMAKTVASSTGAQLKTLSPLEIPPKNAKPFLENVEGNLEILYQELK